MRPPFLSQVRKRFLGGVGCNNAPNGSGGVIGANFTNIIQRPMLGAFTSFFVVYLNKSNAAFTIDSAKAACSATANADGTALAWTNLTFGGSASGVVPAGSGSVNDAVPGVLISDIVYQSSLARTDKPLNLPLVQVRSFSLLGMAGIQVGATDFAAFNASPLAGGAEYASRLPAGDQVAGNTAFQPLDAGTWVVGNVIANYVKRTYHLLCPGDSLTRGQDNINNILGWPTQLQTLRRGQAVQLSANNAGWSGQTHTASMLTARILCAAEKPDGCVIDTWSPNDGHTLQSIFDRTFAEAIDTAKYISGLGIDVYLTTNTPLNGIPNASFLRIQANNQRVRDSGFPYIDFAAAIEMPGNPAQINPLYSSGDGTHLNILGYGAKAARANTDLAFAY